MVSKNDKFNKEDYDDDFIMSLKVDFVFKLIFGDEKNKDILIAFLSAVLRLPEEEFLGLELINTELLKEFKEDRKGILDVRIKTKNDQHIDIEIQLLSTAYMAERTLFYWSKMYNNQVGPGDTFDKLKKCITINIIDFKMFELNKIHTKFHITEDDTGFKLTDVLEVHFLELPKLFDIKNLTDVDDPTLEWLEFINAQSKEEIEVLAEKNDNIKTAYKILKVASKSKEARMAYEARQAEIMDQMTREKTAEERGRKEGLQQGIEKGIEKEKIENAKNFLLLGVDIETIAKGTGLSIKDIEMLKNKLS